MKPAMAHRPWDPLRDLLDLQDRINRLFEESLERGQLPDGQLPRPTWTPLADVCETSEEYIVLIELPGLEREQIEIRADANSVAVRGRRPAVGSVHPENYYRMERSHGPFLRTFELPQEIAADRVTAELHDGVLTLRVPKAGHPPRRVIAKRAE
jgi:HSP20 family protein